MNPLDWGDAVRRRHTYRAIQDTTNQTDNRSMHNASETDDDRINYCPYSRYTFGGPKNRQLAETGRAEGLCPPSHNFDIKDSECDSPDGKPFEIEKEDPELTRKRKELKQIEDQIVQKKFAIALKSAKQCLEPSLPVCPSNERSDRCTLPPLKDRVNAILQRQHPVGFLSKVSFPKDRTKSSSKEGVLPEEHPLKLRVKTLMKQKHSDHCVSPLNIKSSPSSSPVKDSSIDQGFQRFLSVLNKGVDMDMLSRIVNDDSEDLCLGGELRNIQPPQMPDLAFRGESQQSDSGASLSGHSGNNIGQRRTEPLSKERPHSDHLPDSGKASKERGKCNVGSKSRSRSPLGVKVEKKEDIEKTRVKEQHKELQNILKTLGLSLEVEEMSKLANRTQERLYGKNEDNSADSRMKQERQQKGSPRSYENNSSSSSSSSASSSSRSSSRSNSSSPSHCRRSRSRHSRQTSESCSLNDRDELTSQDCNQGSKMQPKNRAKDEKDLRELYQHPYPQNKMYPHPHPEVFAAFPDNILSHCSQYSAYCSDPYKDATNSFLTYSNGSSAHSLYTSSHLYTQIPYHHLPTPVVSSGTVYPCQEHREGRNLLLNPDLSESEGQIGSSSGQQCLQVISLNRETTDRCPIGLTKSEKSRQSKSHCLHQQQKAAEKDALVATNSEKLQEEHYSEEEQTHEEKHETIEEEVRARQSEKSCSYFPADRDSKAKQLGEDKLPKTEEEIKANLRKMLEAFNQKAKNLTQPHSTVTPLSDQIKTCSDS